MCALDRQCSYFGIYDGHGGRDCVNFVLGGPKHNMYYTVLSWKTADADSSSSFFLLQSDIIPLSWNCWEAA